MSAVVGGIGVALATYAVELLVVLAWRARRRRNVPVIDLGEMPMHRSAQPRRHYHADEQLATRFARDGEPSRIRPYVLNMPWIEPGGDLEADLHRALIHAAAAAEALLHNRLDRAGAARQARS